MASLTRPLEHTKAAEHLVKETMARTYPLTLWSVLTEIQQSDRGTLDIVCRIICVPAAPLGMCGCRSARGNTLRLPVVATLAPPLTVTLRGHGSRELDAWERKRVR